MSGSNGNVNRKVTGTALFPVGLCVVTRGAAAAIERLNLHPLIIIARHASGDWGSICTEDRLANEQALKHDARVMSVYKYGEGEDDTLWVITEADRSSTTILLPSEY